MMSVRPAGVGGGGTNRKDFSKGTSGAGIVEPAS